MEGIFEVQQFVNLSWRDPRIQYHNLQEDRTRNSLLEAEKADIWIPTVTFLNTGAQEQSCQRSFVKFHSAQRRSLPELRIPILHLLSMFKPPFGIVS